MIKYFGWIDIVKIFRDDDENNEDHIKYINNFISVNKLDEESLSAKIQPANGFWHLLLSGGANHLNSRVESLFKLINLIPNLAKSSYGLIYFWNDENQHNSYAYNEFEVYTLIRGEVKLNKDPFFSPIYPTIEDDYL